MQLYAEKSGALNFITITKGGCSGVFRLYVLLVSTKYFTGQNIPPGLIPCRERRMPSMQIVIAKSHGPSAPAMDFL